MDPLPPASLSEQGENDFQKWGRKTAEIRHLPSKLTSEKRGNSFFRKMGKYYLLFTPVELQQKIIDLNIGEAPDEKPGKSIYRLRNRIVHHQGVSSNIENLYTEDKWNLLVEYLIEAIIEFHKRFPLT